MKLEPNTPILSAIGSTPVPIEVLQQDVATQNWPHFTMLLTNILRGISKEMIFRIPEGQLNTINRFLQTLFKGFAHSNYQPSQVEAISLLENATTIANLTALSAYGSTDVLLERLLPLKKETLVKALICYSARNRISIDLHAAHQMDPYLSYYWWQSVLSSGIAMMVERTSFEKHKSFFNPEIISLMLNKENFKHHSFSFASNFPKAVNYVYPEQEKMVKQLLNRIISESFPYKIQTIHDHSFDPKHIAVISGCFWRKHAVYKSISPLLKPLKGKYQLTLVSLTNHKEILDELDYDFFDQVIACDLDFGHMAPPPAETIVKSLQQQNFGIAFYPDIGLHPYSVYLSNIRLAPIQIAAYGHPSSSYAEHIDYFLGSKNVECEHSKHCYSEKLLLINGMAAAPVMPTCARSTVKKSEDKIVIACPWAGYKLHADILDVLKEITSRITVPYKLLFTTFTMDKFSGLPAANSLRRALPNIELETMPLVQYTKYMSRLETANLALDSYPFGSFNTVMDLLWCNCPIVTWEGDRASNRLASELLRKIGLEELVAKSRESYIEKAVHLINNQEYRNLVAKKIKVIDFDQTLFNAVENLEFSNILETIIS